MEIELTSEDLEFRQEVRDFLKGNAAKPGADYSQWRMDYFKNAAAKGGWDVPKWPVEFGGPGWSPTQHLETGNRDGVVAVGYALRHRHARADPHELRIQRTN